MFQWTKKGGAGKACAWFSEGVDRAIFVEVDAGRLHVLAASADSTPREIAKRWGPCRGLPVLGPSAYSFGLLPPPEAPGLDLVALKSALRWAFSSTNEGADLDMLTADVEILEALGVDRGGILLKDGYWVFAIERAKLTNALLPAVSFGLRIDTVDTLATAQRNLGWAELRGGDPTPGAYATLVIGKNYSSLGLVSAQGDLIFHKQMEWTEDSLRAPETFDRLVVDLQRNLNYVERRQTALGVLGGCVFGVGAGALSSALTVAMGSFDWKAASYPGVSFAPGAMDTEVDGDEALLIGSLWRWG